VSSQRPRKRMTNMSTTFSYFRDRRPAEPPTFRFRNWIGTRTSCFRRMR